ncbi:1-phosphofructokinase [Pseudolactococcus reticulitermitis]|uniref:Tagatose-6-phosphate kinase n=1 Tax=Pseudolactococcus reticulitermitis TaxID=2025039 RepID=A0A224XE20_9LACT|nr:1-phosphofructokinase [Lactococcus reticulitermitis]GAX47833.1 1-phosphofructokinase [Lactococcus reticulitermitis]
MTKLYTCTMNLAIDLFIETDSMYPEIVNRTNADDIQANGKGVNVSLILKQLGAESTALGFSAGFTGAYIADYLQDKGIETKFVDVAGFTRINVFTQVLDQQTEYKLVNKGPNISQEKMKEFLTLCRQIEKDAFLIVSGSLPQGVSELILLEISQISKENGFHLILDTSYDCVLECLKDEPYLIKPNEEEICQWFGKTAMTVEESIASAQKLIAMGAQRVLLSLGADGAVYLDKEKIIRGNSPKGKVVNTACAGDTLLATFLQGLITGQPLKESLKKAIAAGSSTAFRQGLTDFQDVPNLMAQIQLSQVDLFV